MEKQKEKEKGSAKEKENEKVKQTEKEKEVIKPAQKVTEDLKKNEKEKEKEMKPEKAKNEEKEMEKFNGSIGWKKPDIQVPEKEPAGKPEKDSGWKQPADQEIDTSRKKSVWELPEPKKPDVAKKDGREDRDGGGLLKDREPVSANVPRNARRNQTIQIAPDETGKRF